MRLIDLDEFLRQNCVDRIEGKTCEECKHHVLEVSCERLREQPTIDPVKHGRWVKQTDENCWWYECSECGDYPLKNAYGHEVLSEYCPNCGARMKGGTNHDKHGRAV